jgi:tetratricopeptide (TPR) repeat protein
MCVLLAALTLGVFWPVVHCGLTNYDDFDYITNNPHVLSGLTWENVRWAFANAYYDYWHPLAWISHMADMELFGGNAGGYHLTSLLIHVANTLLLFWVLQSMTGAVGRSAVVAALFAVHPLHVESVAWVTERKDVLSAFFFLLTLLAYARYAQVQSLKSQVSGLDSQSQVHSPQPTDHGPRTMDDASRSTLHAPRYYLLALFCFALGLMSKPMVVTTPFVLLLLDYWPLRRLELKTQDSRPKTLSPLLLEKVPFVVLAAVCSVGAFLAQKQVGAMHSLASLGLGARLANAAVSYVRYLGKMVWPARLAVFYPLRPSWPAWQVLLAAAILVAVSAAAIRLARRHAFFPVGWFWYLGTLVPVIGLIQVGAQAMADRYTYIPLIGLFIVLAWGGWEWAARWPRRNLLAGGAALVVVAVLAVGTRVQLQYWRTGRALLEHSLEAGGGAAVIHGNLGVILAEERSLEEAKRHFLEALRLEPDYVRARFGLVGVLAREGKMDEADRAVQGLWPGWEAEARRQLGEAFLQQTNVDAAIAEFLAAAKVQPTNAPIREKLALTLARAGRTTEASEQFAALVRLRPDAQAHYYLALSLHAAGKPDQAVEEYRQALQLRPDWPEALNDLAWLLATDPRAEVRRPEEAVQLAERASALSGYREARFLGTLDAAYAGAGRFAEAITTGEEARKLALAAGDQAVADAAATRLELYRAGRPYYQP